MLDAMRKNTKTILWIVIAAFVALIFLVWGMDVGFQGGPGGTGAVGKVNGEPISYNAYMQAIEQGRSEFRSRNGRDPYPREEVSLARRAWDDAISEMLVRQEARRLGITASDPEVLFSIKSNPPPLITQNQAFQVNGQFDYQRYLQELQNPNQDWTLLEEYVRSMLPVEKVQLAIFSTAKVTEDEVRATWVERNDRVRFTLFDFGRRVLYRPPDKIAEPDLKAFFEANREEFRAPRQTKVRFVRLERKPSAGDSAAVRLRAEGLARDALAGSDFATLAETWSESPTAANGGLVPAYAKASDLTPEVRSALFPLAPGQTSGVVLDRKGVHVFRLEGTQGKGDTTRFQYREILLTIQPSDSTISNSWTRILELKNRSKKEGFEKAAEAMGIPVTESEWFGEAGFAPQLGGVPETKAWAKRAKAGEVSPVFLAPDGWFVLELAQRREETVPPFDEIKADVQRKFLAADRLKRVKAISDRFFSAVASGSTPEAAAARDSVQAVPVSPIARFDFIPGVGRESKLLGAAFALPPGKLSGPIETERSIYALRVEERMPPDESLYVSEREQLKEQLLNQKRQEAVSAWLESLREKAKIEDFREQFFQI
jgi:peptidyl-prolyl cis-trans isomerase D